MAFFSLLWKARTIEKYRLKYENEKIKSILSSDTELPKNNFMQKCRHFHYDTKKQMKKKFRQWCPEGSAVSNFLIYVRMDQTFPNFLFKSLIGFVGGIILTYLCFMFFVFQLSISLIHATFMSSIIGILLTLGLAFSYRIRCLVFLLIPQFFSRVGRYTLTCYALVLILTGPATNTLKNSEVLSESMACGQEQIKASVRQLNDSYKNPLNLVKDSIKIVVERMKLASCRLREMLLRMNRLLLTIANIFQSLFSWLLSLVPLCNRQFGSPYTKCVQAVRNGCKDYQDATFGSSEKYDCNSLAELVCWTVKTFNAVCIPQDYMNRDIATVVKRKLNSFSNHIKLMLHVDVHVHHTYSFNSNVSKTASQAAAGIVTEIRNRADPLLTWLSWSSCVTSLFLLLIIFRAKYYQHMFETRSRFDNRYLTKELRELDFKRQKQGKETILPLNRRERMKYICTTSFQLVPSERVYLSRSAVFMTITTFKLLIHIVADYSLYWILMTIRQHGRFQTPMTPGYPESGVKITGIGPVAKFMQAIIEAFYIPLNAPSPMPVTCLPDPLPPDIHRYTQISVLIFLLWFFALFEPYGLRLRHVIMGMYNPERAKARAAWLYNHILTTRAGFMKCARRKLHRQYKYSSEKKLTFKYWLNSYLPFQWLQALFGTGPEKPQCLLCSTREIPRDPDTELIFCETQGCPGIFCLSCFADIGQLCTICLSPADYGDVSDISLELGSSDDSNDSDFNDDDDNDDSSDEKKLLLGRPQLKRKLSRTDNTSRTQTFRMSEIKFQQRKNYEGEGDSCFKIIEKHNISTDCNKIYKDQKVDCNNNIIKSVNTKQKLIDNNKYDKYFNLAVDLSMKHHFAIDSNNIVFSIAQELTKTKAKNAFKEYLSQTLKLGFKAHEIKLKKKNYEKDKLIRGVIHIKLGIIKNVFINTKRLLQNLNFSQYCLKINKKRFSVKKIEHRITNAKLKRKSICIKTEKHHDNCVENYLKNLRYLKLMTRAVRLPNMNVQQINPKIEKQIVLSESLNEQSSFENYIKTQESLINERNVIVVHTEDITLNHNVDENSVKTEHKFVQTNNKWNNRRNTEHASKRCTTKKTKSVTWDPRDMLCNHEEFNSDFKLQKLSKETVISCNYRNKNKEHFISNSNVIDTTTTSYSKSSNDKAPSDKKYLKTCTCATQHRESRRTMNTKEKGKRDIAKAERRQKRYNMRDEYELANINYR